MTSSYMFIVQTFANFLVKEDNLSFIEVVFANFPICKGILVLIEISS